MDEMTLTLNSPLTEEQWDAIMDVDLENTPRIMFHTKNGQEVWYEKRKKLPPIYKRGTDVVHVSYADGRSGFEYHKWADWVCPECGWFVGEQYVPRRHNQNRANFCARCGCEIDWENAKEGEDETD